MKIDNDHMPRGCHHVLLQLIFFLINRETKWYLGSVILENENEFSYVLLGHASHFPQVSCSWSG